MDFKRLSWYGFKKDTRRKNALIWRQFRTEISPMKQIQGRKLKPFQGSNLQVTGAVSQQLWTSGGALSQRAQEPNLPFGESPTSTNTNVNRGWCDSKQLMCELLDLHKWRSKT